MYSAVLLIMLLGLFHTADNSGIPDRLLKKMNQDIVKSGGKMTSTGFWLADNIEEIQGLKMGPFARHNDGRRWSKPVIIARNIREERASYPYLFEARPGEIWITAMQGNLRIRLREDDFIR